jgi:site-specific recombinase
VLFNRLVPRMLSILERLDPHSDRIDLLVELVDCLRPPRPWQHERARERVRTLVQLLRGNPRQAGVLRSYLTRLLEERRHTSLYSEVGIVSNDGFFTELKRRIAYRFLPPALDDRYLSDSLEEVLRYDTDYIWIREVPNADWLALFDVIAQAPVAPEAEPDRARAVTLMGLLDAIRTLSCRICALGLEPRLVHAYSEIEEVHSPFLMQNIEVNQYLDAYGRYLHEDGAQPEDARPVLVMLDQCDDVVTRIRKSALAGGTSIALTYLLVALTQSIDRLRKLLFLVDINGKLPSPPTVDIDEIANDATPPWAPPASPHRAAAIALAHELIEAHTTKYHVTGLVRDNIDLLARNVTENASRTGEHYIAESRSDLRSMFRSSAGAGFVVGLMAMFKILLSYLRAAPLVEALLFSMNYSLGFMLVHVLHWTIATKQPAMTAQRIAADLHSSDGRRIDVDSLAELVTKVFRTQLVAVLGNIATCFPTAFVLAVGWRYATGRHLVAPAKAQHLLHEIDPFHSPALLYAATAAVWLFLSGLISGYYDNKALYTRMAQRVRQLKGLGRLLGQRRLDRLGLYLEDNLGGLAGNFYFGVLMGFTATIGYLVGLPLDVRHVTFSAANFATALVGLDYMVTPDAVGNAIAGTLLIGVVNLVVSFGLALWVALRARKIRFRHGIRLMHALGRRARTAPITFLLGPKDAELATAANTKGKK